MLTLLLLNEIFFFFRAPRRGANSEMRKSLHCTCATIDKAKQGGKGDPRVAARLVPFGFPNFIVRFFFFSFRKNLQLIIFHIFLYNKLANQISAFLEHPNIYIYIYINVPNFIIEILKNVPNFSL